MKSETRGMKRIARGQWQKTRVYATRHAEYISLQMISAETSLVFTAHYSSMFIGFDMPVGSWLPTAFVHMWADVAFLHA